MDYSQNSNLDIQISEFPSTRYQGSKRKLIPWIYGVIKDLEFRTCLDAFGGTASVSYLFKKMGKQVTFNDYLKFNYIIGKAIIENSHIKLARNDISSLKIKSNSTFIKNTFDNIYYLKHENSWIDKVSSNIENMNHYSSDILNYKKSLAYYALFQSCLIKRPFNLFHRKNLNLRTNDVERNFGNKTTWDKPFYKHFEFFVKEANRLVFDSGIQCNSTNESAFEINGDFDLVYIDPPYFSMRSDNSASDYLSSYHFLEGLSKFKDWKNLIDFESINLRFKKSEDNNIITIDNVYEKIEELLYRFRKSIIVFSYKYGGAPSATTLKKYIRLFKKNVFTVTKHYTYALNHQNGDKINNREILIVGY